MQFKIKYAILLYIVIFYQHIVHWKSLFHNEKNKAQKSLDNHSIYCYNCKAVKIFCYSVLATTVAIMTRRRCF